MKRSIILSLLLFCCIGLFAQSTEEKKWIDKAKSLNESEDYRGSLSAYLKAYKLNPKNAETLYQIAWTYNDVDVYDSALIFAQKGLAVDSKDERLYNESGYE